MTKPKVYPPELKARLALEAVEGTRTVAQIASEHGISPQLVYKWKAELQQNAARAFSAASDEADLARERAGHAEEVDSLHRLVGQLTAERDFLQRGLLKRYGVGIGDVADRPGV